MLFLPLQIEYIISIVKSNKSIFWVHMSPQMAILDINVGISNGSNN